ncbi:hypothetical protein H8959_021003 [Pygathrix nigripes]
MGCQVLMSLMLRDKEVGNSPKEIVGVVAVHIYIEKHQQLRAKSHSEFLKKSTFARLPPYRYRFRRRSSSRSTEPRSRDLSPISKGFHTIPSNDISIFPREHTFYESKVPDRAVRASSVFPILSVTLLFFGGLCVAASEFHRSRHNVILSAGIFFVSAGLSNIIGIIVYISANAGDPGQRDSKKSYSYGWSFYFGAFSFIIAEIVGVVAVHIYIEKHQQLRAKSHSEFLKKSTFARLPPYRYRFRRRSSSRSTEPRSRDLSPISKGFHTIPSTDISMFTLSRDPSKITMGTLLNSDRDHAFLQFHNSTPKEFKESLHNNPANRRTTPV